MTASPSDLDRKVSPRKRYRPHPKITIDMIVARTWYALKVASQKEFMAQDMLADMGLLTYVPVRKEWRHKTKFDKAKRQKVLVSYPIARGYVLAGFTPGQLWAGCVPHWLKIFSLSPVIGVVGFQNQPKTLSLKELKEFATAHPNGLQKPKEEAFMRTHREFNVGDTVRACAGPFADHEAPVVSIRGPKTRVLLELFGSPQEIEFETYDLEKVS